jgi:hypothetical protein
MRKHYSFAQAKRLADERVRRFGMRGIARGVSISQYQKPKMIRVRGFLVERGGDFHKRLLGMKKKDRQIVAQYERGLVGNPPMYAHRMMSHRTHGLSLKQMMKLYRLVSSGNPKAVMFARRTLGIPMSESLQQVKAVVYHHVLDLKGKI